MTNTEAITLDVIQQRIDAYNRENPTFKDYHENIEKLNIGSLQEIACQKDWAYLRKISTVLNVIMSIVAHPHISNRQEEIVTRIEQAKQLSNEDFSRVMKNGSLWKRYNLRMVPENVYYYQNVDELCIYENQFVCLVTDLLLKELNEYTNFYIKMLPSMKNGILPCLDGRKPQKILVYADGLKRRITYLKNTRFYKEVSKSKPISRNIQRTNILLKDNLYHRVYRFYREYLGTEERFITYNFMYEYLSVRITKELFSRGFKPLKRKKGDIKIFENASFLLSLAPYNQNRGLVLEITEKLSQKTTKHLMMLSLSAWFSDIEKAETGYDAVDALSMWASVNVSKNAEDFEEIFTEDEIVKKYFDDKLCLSVTKSDVYTRYCPVCRERNVVETNGLYSCSRCSSRYVFTKTIGGEDAVWFLRLRRHR